MQALPSLNFGGSRGSSLISNMARFFSITSSKNLRRGARKKTIGGRGFKIGPVSLCLITIILLCFLSLFYLAQANRIASRGYEIRELEEGLSRLEEENRKLELKAAELQSVKYIEEEVKHLNMVPIGKVVYITPLGSTVALGE